MLTVLHRMSVIANLISGSGSREHIGCRRPTTLRKNAVRPPVLLVNGRLQLA